MTVANTLDSMMRQLVLLALELLLPVFVRRYIPLAFPR